MSDWKLKCPSCGELMGDGVPYKTLTAFDMPEHATEMRAGDPEPDWLEHLPIAGHKFSCKCGCTLDIPTKPSTVTPGGNA